MSRIIPSPEQLDQQSPYPIDEWIDVGSSRAKQLVQDQRVLHYFLRTGMNHFLFTDLLGRIWGTSNDQTWFPFHDEVGGKRYGWRMSSRAAN